MSQVSKEIRVTNEVYYANRQKTLSETVLEQHRGQWVALSPDGCQIIASESTFDKLMQQVKAAGENPERVHVKRIASDEEGMPLGGVELQ